jgi:uncharacterized integral membrane protein
MSASSQTPSHSEQKPERRARRQQARSLAVVIMAIVVTVFAVLNLNQVKVDWIIGSGSAPLIIVIVVSLLVGVALGHFAERRSSKRR